MDGNQTLVVGREGGGRAIILHPGSPRFSDVCMWFVDEIFSSHSGNAKELYLAKGNYFPHLYA